jgi:cytochrome P450/NADPH-cytochrome P450 reductase
MACPYSPANNKKQSSDSDEPPASCPFSTNSISVTSKNAPINKDANEPIPQPPVHWFTKNISEIDPTFPVSSAWRLAAIYGEIFKLDLITHDSVFISSHELINEVMDEDRFEKTIQGTLKETRALLGDGIFTAYQNEPVRNFYKLLCVYELT